MQHDFKMCLDPLTCYSDPDGCTLHPGTGVVVAVPGPAAVIPRLLWAQLGQKEGSSMVSKGIVRLGGLNKGNHVGLQRKNTVVQKPGDKRKSSSGDLTRQSGSGKYGISSVKIFNLHAYIASNWNWTNKEERNKD